MKKVLTFLSLNILFLSSGLTAQSPGIKWQKTFGGSLNDDGYSITSTSENYLLVTGQVNSADGDITESFGGGDGWVSKYTNDGNLVWKKAYGGSGWDDIWDIVETNDHNYLFFSISDSNDGDINNPLGLSDFWIVKTDTNGEIIWKKNYGGSGSEGGGKIIKNTDGSFILIGFSDSDDGNFADNHGNFDYAVMKINETGDIIWSRSFGGSGLDMALDGMLDSEGNILITGYAFSDDGDFSNNKGGKDIWVLKLNQNGNILWKKNIGGSDHDESYCLAEDSDGNYIIGINTRSNNIDFDNNYGGMDGWLFFLDKNGNILNKSHFGGSYADAPLSVIVNNDGNLIVGGITASSDGDISYNHGNYDFWLLKLNSTGEIMWEKTYGGSERDHLWKLIAFDGGFAGIGETSSNDGDVSGNHGERDFWIVRFTGESMETDESDFSPIRIFPNPVENKLNITSKKEIAHIEITDLSGRSIQKFNLNTKYVQLRTSHISKGIYLVKITTREGDTYIKKLIKN